MFWLCIKACLLGIKFYVLLMSKKLVIYYISSFFLWLYFLWCHKYVAFLGWKIIYIFLTRLENNIFFGTERPGKSMKNKDKGWVFEIKCW